MLEVLKNIETRLENCVYNQTDNLQKVDTRELGEAIDMIKDMSEAIYYQTITQSMEKVDSETYDDMPLQVTSSETKMYHMPDHTNYMEGKKTHKDTNSQLHELEKYLKQLSDNIMVMMKDSSPEEKTMFRQKMAMIVDKI